MLTRKQLTAAVARYARRHGYYHRTVRTVSVLFYAAIREYRESQKCCEAAPDRTRVPVRSPD